MGAGNAYDPANGPGVTNIWVQDNSQEVRGLGWIAGTHYRTLSLVYQLTDPTAPPPQDELTAIARDIRDTCIKILEILEAAL